MFRIFILLVLLPLAGTAISQVYKTTDEDGNVVFTDNPNPDNAANTQSVGVERTNITAPPTDIPALREKPAPEPKAIPLTVTITSPVNETVIPRGPGNFSVSAAASTPLKGGDSLQLFIDGTAHGEPQSSGQWQLTNIFRGQHDLTVSWINGEGEAVASSDPVRIYVFRPSSKF